MHIIKAVLGLIAAVAIARLIAPEQTDEMIENAKRAVSAGANSAKRRASTMADAVAEPVTVRSKSSAASRKGKTSKVRAAARRPAHAAT
jgi:hypothetical protein